MDGRAIAFPVSAEPIADRRPETRDVPRLLGAGRSGVVHARIGADGEQLVARKTFGARGAVRLVQVALLGAPNPYLWNLHAIRSALVRRRILAILVEHWLGDRLEVAVARGYDWDPAARAYFLDTELVEGRHPRLINPFSDRGRAEYAELARDVLVPLRAHLREAGFDGLMWQAGYGHPVAAGNFLRREPLAGRARWVWVDLESGVPALFPSDPRALLGFYLPRALHHGAPLFDDVDIPRLRAYLRTRRKELAASRGATAVRELEGWTHVLEAEQSQWKAPGRVEQGVAWQQRRGMIDEAAAERYRRWPALWYGHLAGRAVRKTAGLARRAPAALWRFVRRLPLRRIFGDFALSLADPEHRVALARRWVRARADAWAERGQLDASARARLEQSLSDDAGSIYLADFGVHLALKPVVKAVEIWLLPLLFAFGVISAGLLAVAVVFGGSVARTIYTAWRVGRTSRWSSPRPWLALLVGVVPVLGNFAFPLQILRSGEGSDDPAARFIVLDAASLAARAVPFWGGRDTGTEHALNHAAAWCLQRVGVRPAPWKRAARVSAPEG